jgi:arsenate reductase-like glutaredoxin family protein
MANPDFLSEKKIGEVYQWFVQQNPNYDIYNKEINASEEEKLGFLPQRNDGFKQFFSQAYGEDSLSKYQREIDLFLEQRKLVDEGAIKAKDDIGLLQTPFKIAAQTIARGADRLAGSSQAEVASAIGNDTNDQSIPGIIFGELSRYGAYAGAGFVAGGPVGMLAGTTLAAGLDFYDALMSNYETTYKETGDPEQASNAMIATSPIAATEFLIDHLTHGGVKIVKKMGLFGAKKVGTELAEELITGPALTKGLFPEVQKASLMMYDSIFKGSTKTTNQLLKETAKSMGMEGVSEAFLGEYLNNEVVDAFIEGNYYDPTVGDILKAGLVGSIVGGVATAGTGAAFGEKLSFTEANKTQTGLISKVAMDVLMDTPNSGSLPISSKVVSGIISNSEINLPGSKQRLQDLIEVKDQDGKAVLVKKQDLFDDKEKAQFYSKREENINRQNSLMQQEERAAVNENLSGIVKTAEDSRLAEERNNTDFFDVLKSDKNKLTKDIGLIEESLKDTSNQILAAKKLIESNDPSIDRLNAENSIKELENKSLSLVEELDKKLVTNLQLENDSTSGLVQKLNKGGQEFLFKDFVKEQRDSNTDLISIKEERKITEEFAKKRLETENQIKEYKQLTPQDPTPADFKKAKRKEFYSNVKDTLPSIASFLQKYEKAGGSKSGFSGIKSKTINDLIKIGEEPVTITQEANKEPKAVKALNNIGINKKIESVRSVLKNNSVKDPNEAKSVLSFLDNYKPEREYESLKNDPLSKEQLDKAREIVQNFEEERVSKKEEIKTKKEEKKKTLEEQKIANRISLPKEGVTKLSNEAKAVYSTLDPERPLVDLQKNISNAQKNLNKESVSGTVSSLANAEAKAKILNEVISTYKDSYSDNPIINSLELIERGKQKKSAKAETIPATKESKVSATEEIKVTTKSEPEPEKTVSAFLERIRNNFNLASSYGIGKTLTYKDRLNALSNSVLLNNLSDVQIKEKIKKDFANESKRSSNQILADVKEVIKQKQQLNLKNKAEQRNKAEVTQAYFSGKTPELAKNLFERIRERYTFNRPFQFITKQELEQGTYNGLSKKEADTITADLNNNNASGIYYANLNKHVVVIDLSKVGSQEELLHSIGHEVGHAFIADHFDGLSVQEKNALRSDYETFLSDVGATVDEDGNITIDENSFNKDEYLKQQFPFISNIKASKDLNYNTMFIEWAANEFAKAPSGNIYVGDSFTKKLFNYIKKQYIKLLSTLKKDFGLPASSIKNMINGTYSSIKKGEAFSSMTRSEAEFKNKLYNKLPSETINSIKTANYMISSVSSDKNVLVNDINTYYSANGKSISNKLNQYLANKNGISSTSAKNTIRTLSHILNSNLFTDSISKNDTKILGLPFQIKNNNIFLEESATLVDSISALGASYYNNFTSKVADGSIRQELVDIGRKIYPHTTNLSINNSFYERLGFADFFRKRLLGLKTDSPLTNKFFNTILNNSDPVIKDIFNTSSSVLTKYFDQDRSLIQELDVSPDLQEQFEDQFSDKSIFKNIKNFLVKGFYNNNYTNYRETMERFLGRQLQAFENPNELSKAYAAVDGVIKNFIDNGLYIPRKGFVTPLKDILSVIPLSKRSSFNNYLMSRNLLERNNIRELQVQSYKNYLKRIKDLQEKNVVITKEQLAPLPGEIDYMPAPIEVKGSTINLEASRLSLKGLSSEDATMFSHVAEEFYLWRDSTLEYLKNISPAMSEEVDTLLASPNKSYVPITTSQQMGESEVVQLKAFLKNKNIYEKFGNTITGEVLDPITATLLKFRDRLHMVYPKQVFNSIADHYNEAMALGTPIVGVTKINVNDLEFTPKSLDILQNYSKAKNSLINRAKKILEDKDIKGQPAIFTKEMAQLIDSFGQVFESSQDVNDSDYVYINRTEEGQNVIYAFEKDFAKQFLTQNKDIVATDGFRRFIKAIGVGIPKALIYYTALKASPVYYIGQYMADASTYKANSKNNRNVFRSAADYLVHTPFIDSARQAYFGKSDADKFIEFSGVGNYNMITQNNEKSIEAIRSLHPDDIEIRDSLTGNILNIGKKGVHSLDKSLEFIMNAFDKTGRKAEARGYFKSNNVDFDSLTFPQLIELMSAVKSVTSNFAMKGNYTKALSNVFPLISGNLAGLGAGLDRLNYALRNKETKYILQLAPFMALALASALELKDDETYKLLNDDEKRDRIHISVGDTLVGIKMQHPILIAMKTAIDTLANNIESPYATAISTAQQLTGLSFFGMNPTIKIAANLFGGVDLNEIDSVIRGEPGSSSIINKREGFKPLATTKISDSRTSQIAINLGDFLGKNNIEIISPKQIDLTIQAMTGKIGEKLVKLAGGKSENELKADAKKEADPYSFIFGSLVKDKKQLNASRTNQKVYAKATELTTIINSLEDTIKKDKTTPIIPKDILNFRDYILSLKTFNYQLGRAFDLGLLDKETFLYRKNEVNKMILNSIELFEKDYSINSRGYETTKSDSDRVTFYRYYKEQKNKFKRLNKMAEKKLDSLE